MDLVVDSMRSGYQARQYSLGRSFWVTLSSFPILPIPFQRYHLAAGQTFSGRKMQTHRLYSYEKPSSEFKEKAE